MFIIQVDSYVCGAKAEIAAAILYARKPTITVNLTYERSTRVTSIRESCYCGASSQQGFTISTWLYLQLGERSIFFKFEQHPQSQIKG